MKTGLALITINAVYTQLYLDNNNRYTVSYTRELWAKSIQFP